MARVLNRPVLADAACLSKCARAILHHKLQRRSSSNSNSSNSNTLILSRDSQPKLFPFKEFLSQKCFVLNKAQDRSE
eukprot:1141631-Pelagomonas_calceolata.AAC.7